MPVQMLWILTFAKKIELTENKKVEATTIKFPKMIPYRMLLYPGPRTL